MALSPYAQVAIQKAGLTAYGENFVPTANLSTTVFYPPATEVNLGLAPETVDRSDELRGTLQQIKPDIVGFGTADGSFAIRNYPNYMGLWLFLALGAPVTTPGDGTITDLTGSTIPTGASRHRWDSALVPTEVRVARITRGFPNEAVYLRDDGVTATAIEWGAGADNDYSTATVSLSSLYQSRITNPSLTPTVDAVTVAPFDRGNMAVTTWLTGSGIATDMTFNLSNPVEPFRGLGAASRWYSTFQRPNDPGGATPRLSGTLTTRNIDAEDWDAIIAGTTWNFLTTQTSRTNIGATAFPYKFNVSGFAGYTGGDMDAMHNAVRHGMTLPWSATISGASSAFVIELVNSVSSYSSVS